MNQVTKETILKWIALIAFWVIGLPFLSYYGAPPLFIIILLVATTFFLYKTQNLSNSIRQKTKNISFDSILILVLLFFAPGLLILYMLYMLHYSSK